MRAARPVGFVSSRTRCWEIGTRSWEPRADPCQAGVEEEEEKEVGASGKEPGSRVPLNL